MNTRIDTLIQLSEGSVNLWTNRNVVVPNGVFIIDTLNKTIAKGNGSTLDVDLIPILDFNVDGLITYDPINDDTPDGLILEEGTDGVLTVSDVTIQSLFDQLSTITDEIARLNTLAGSLGTGGIDLEEPALADEGKIVVGGKGEMLRVAPWTISQLVNDISEYTKYNQGKAHINTIEFYRDEAMTTPISDTSFDEGDEFFVKVDGWHDNMDSSHLHYDLKCNDYDVSVTPLNPVDPKSMTVAKMGRTSSDELVDITTDSNGNSYVATSMSYTSTSGGVSMIFVFDSSGNNVIRKSLPSGYSVNRISIINNEVYMTGSFNNGITTVPILIVADTTIELIEVLKYTELTNMQSVEVVVEDDTRCIIVTTLTNTDIKIISDIGAETSIVRQFPGTTLGDIVYMNGHIYVSGTPDLIIKYRVSDGDYSLIRAKLVDNIVEIKNTIYGVTVANNGIIVNKYNQDLSTHSSEAISIELDDRYLDASVATMGNSIIISTRNTDGEISIVEVGSDLRVLSSYTLKSLLKSSNPSNCHLAVSGNDILVGTNLEDGAYLIRKDIDQNVKHLITNRLNIDCKKVNVTSNTYELPIYGDTALPTMTIRIVGSTNEINNVSSRSSLLPCIKDTVLEEGQEGKFRVVVNNNVNIISGSYDNTAVRLLPMALKIKQDTIIGSASTKELMYTLHRNDDEEYLMVTDVSYCTSIRYKLNVNENVIRMDANDDVVYILTSVGDGTDTHLYKVNRYGVIQSCITLDYTYTCIAFDSARVYLGSSATTNGKTEISIDIINSSTRITRRKLTDSNQGANITDMFLINNRLYVYYTNNTSTVNVLAVLSLEGGILFKKKIELVTGMSIVDINEKSILITDGTSSFLGVISDDLEDLDFVRFDSTGSLDPVSVSGNSVISKYSVGEVPFVTLIDLDYGSASGVRVKMSSSELEVGELVEGVNNRVSFDSDDGTILLTKRSTDYSSLVTNDDITVFAYDGGELTSGLPVGSITDYLVAVSEEYSVSDKVNHNFNQSLCKEYNTKIQQELANTRNVVTDDYVINVTNVDGAFHVLSFNRKLEKLFKYEFRISSEGFDNNRGICVNNDTLYVYDNQRTKFDIRIGALNLISGKVEVYEIESDEILSASTIYKGSEYMTLMVNDITTYDSRTISISFDMELVRNLIIDSDLILYPTYLVDIDTGYIACFSQGVDSSGGYRFLIVEFDNNDIVINSTKVIIPSMVSIGGTFRLVSGDTGRCKYFHRLGDIYKLDFTTTTNPVITKIISGLPTYPNTTGCVVVDGIMYTNCGLVIDLDNDRYQLVGSDLVNEGKIFSTSSSSFGSYELLEDSWLDLLNEPVTAVVSESPVTVTENDSILEKITDFSDIDSNYVSEDGLHAIVTPMYTSKREYSPIVSDYQGDVLLEITDSASMVDSNIPKIELLSSVDDGTIVSSKAKELELYGQDNYLTTYYSTNLNSRSNINDTRYSNGVSVSNWTSYTNNVSDIDRITVCNFRNEVTETRDCILNMYNARTNVNGFYYDVSTDTYHFMIFNLTASSYKSILYYRFVGIDNIDFSTTPVTVKLSLTTSTTGGYHLQGGDIFKYEGEMYYIARRKNTTTSRTGMILVRLTDDEPEFVFYRYVNDSVENVYHASILSGDRIFVTSSLSDGSLMLVEIDITGEIADSCYYYPYKSESIVIGGPVHSNGIVFSDNKFILNCNSWIGLVDPNDISTVKQLFKIDDTMDKCLASSYYNNTILVTIQYINGDSCMFVMSTSYEVLSDVLYVDGKVEVSRDPASNKIIIDQTELKDGEDHVHRLFAMNVNDILKLPNYGKIGDMTYSLSDNTYIKELVSSNIDVVVTGSSNSLIYNVSTLYDGRDNSDRITSIGLSESDSEIYSKYIGDLDGRYLTINNLPDTIVDSLIKLDDFYYCTVQGTDLSILKLDDKLNIVSSKTITTSVTVQQTNLITDNIYLYLAISYDTSDSIVVQKYSTDLTRISSVDLSNTTDSTIYYDSIGVGSVINDKLWLATFSNSSTIILNKDLTMNNSNINITTERISQIIEFNDRVVSVSKTAGTSLSTSASSSLRLLVYDKYSNERLYQHLITNSNSTTSHESSVRKIGNYLCIVLMSDGGDDEMIILDSSFRFVTGFTFSEAYARINDSDDDYLVYVDRTNNRIFMIDKNLDTHTWVMNSDDIYTLKGVYNDSNNVILSIVDELTYPNLIKFDIHKLTISTPFECNGIVFSRLEYMNNNQLGPANIVYDDIASYPLSNNEVTITNDTQFLTTTDNRVNGTSFNDYNEEIIVDGKQLTISNGSSGSIGGNLNILSNGNRVLSIMDKDTTNISIVIVDGDLNVVNSRTMERDAYIDGHDTLSKDNYWPHASINSSDFIDAIYGVWKYHLGNGLLSFDVGCILVVDDVIYFSFCDKLDNQSGDCYLMKFNSDLSLISKVKISSGSAFFSIYKLHYTNNGDILVIGESTDNNGTNSATYAALLDSTNMNILVQKFYSISSTSSYKNDTIYDIAESSDSFYLVGIGTGVSGLIYKLNSNTLECDISRRLEYNSNSENERIFGVRIFGDDIVLFIDVASDGTTDGMFAMTVDADLLSWDDRVIHYGNYDKRFIGLVCDNKEEYTLFGSIRDRDDDQVNFDAFICNYIGYPLDTGVFTSYALHNDNNIGYNEVTSLIMDGDDVLITINYQSLDGTRISNDILTIDRSEFMKISIGDKIGDYNVVEPYTLVTDYTTFTTFSEFTAKEWNDRVEDTSIITSTIEPTKTGQFYSKNKKDLIVTKA